MEMLIQSSRLLSRFINVTFPSHQACDLPHSIQMKLKTEGEKTTLGEQPCATLHVPVNSFVARKLPK